MAGVVLTCSGQRIDGRSYWSKVDGAQARADAGVIVPIGGNVESALVQVAWDLHLAEWLVNSCIEHVRMR